MMKEGYRGKLADGREVYIPHWPVTVQFENLTLASKYFGQQNVIKISTLSVPTAMGALMGSDDHKNATQFILHCTQQARLDNEKISTASFEELGISLLIEIFTHVMHSQYHDFFESGLAKVRFPKD